jgi:hypothetical protein
MQGGWVGDGAKIPIRGKVLTNFTTLVINNLNAYTSPYIFWKVFTPLIINDLNTYTIVNGDWRHGQPLQGGHQKTPRGG